MRRFLLPVTALFMMVSCSGNKLPQLHVYNWDDYIEDSIIEDFEKEFNCRVIYDTYASNEDLMAKLQAGASGYDVIFPSDYAVTMLAEEGRLMPLDKTKLPNMVNIEPYFLDPPFDPGLVYSMPYTYGFSGIGYDSDAFEEAPDSWDVFWDENYAGRMLLLDDMREVFGMAFKKLGYSINDTDPEHLQQALDILKDQRKYLKKYESSMSKDLMLTGEVLLIHHWSGDVYQIMEEDSTIGFSIPREGSILFTDCMAIPADAPNPDLAHAFINYIMDGRNSAKIVNTIWYPVPNKAAYQYIDEEILTDTNIFPKPEVLGNSEFIRDLGEYTPIMDRAWSELKM